MTGSFQQRFAEALRRRMFPNSGLHLKQLAGGVGRSENTVSRWWRGETRISAEDLNRIAAFLARRGDRNFLFEIFGEAVPAAKAGSDFEETLLALVRTAFAQLSEDPSRRDTHLWCMADGYLADAPQGHTAFAGQYPRADMLDDPLTYALREWGWIAITLRPEGVAEIRHDGRNVAPLAAERCAEWLRARRETLLSVRRGIHIDGCWTKVTHDNMAGAIAAITILAVISHQPRHRWTVRQLPLDAITDLRLIDLMRLYRQMPDNIVHAAGAPGAFSTSSVLRVDGGDVISHHVATSFGLDYRGEGQNVLARPDTDYALMIRDRVLRIKNEGPLYHELTGSIRNRFVRYLNLGLPETGSSGRVLTSSVLLEG